MINSLSVVDALPSRNDNILISEYASDNGRKFASVYFNQNTKFYWIHFNDLDSKGNCKMTVFHSFWLLDDILDEAEDFVLED